MRRFLVIDDHPLMRDAVTRALANLQFDGRVDTASTLAEALARLGEDGPFDLALLDLQLPDANGFEALRTLRRERPECPVVVLSGDLDGQTILQCLEMGAAGYIPKTLHSDAVMNALRVVTGGDIYVPMQAVAAERALRPGQPPLRRASHTDPRSLGLTERQIDVLRLILRGMPNKIICRTLNLAEGTIKVHVSAVLRALGVRNRTQAIIAANQLGLQLSMTAEPLAATTGSLAELKARAVSAA